MKKDSSENFPMHWNDWRIAWQFHDLTPLKSKANHTEHQTAHIFTRLMANGNLFSSHDLLVFLLSLQSKRAHNQSEKKNCDVRFQSGNRIHQSAVSFVCGFSVLCSITEADRFNQSSFIIPSSRLIDSNGEWKEIWYHIQLNLYRYTQLPLTAFTDHEMVYIYIGNLHHTIMTWSQLMSIKWTSLIQHFLSW